jgi:hypothetical protein
LRQHVSTSAASDGGSRAAATDAGEGISNCSESFAGAEPDGRSGMLWMIPKYRWKVACKASMVSSFYKWHLLSQLPSHQEHSYFVSLRNMPFVGGIPRDEPGHGERRM